MPIKRTFDAAALNDVANSADVRPWLLGEGVIDLTAAVGNPSNVTLQADGGGFVMLNAGDGDYEVHSIFARGAKTAPAAMQAGFDYMFTSTDCVRLTTKVPDGNSHAFRLADAGGFKVLFRNAVSGVACMELTLDRWVAGCADLEAEGEWFHTRIDEAARNLPAHPADAQHDRAVGAAVRMIQRQNVMKGVGFYNRWAAMAGYPGVKLLSLHPPILDMIEAVVAVHGEDMEVLSCQ